MLELSLCTTKIMFATFFWAFSCLKNAAFLLISYSVIFLPSRAGSYVACAFAITCGVMMELFQ